MRLLYCEDFKFLRQKHQAVGVKGCIVHLSLPQGSQLPIRHLFSFTEGLPEYGFDHFRQTYLSGTFLYRLPVFLDIEKPGKSLEKVHSGQGLLKHGYVTAEAEPDGKSPLVSKNLGQFGIEGVTSRHLDQIYNKCICFTAELENGEPLVRERFNVGSPLGVHAD